MHNINWNLETRWEDVMCFIENVKSRSFLIKWAKIKIKWKRQWYFTVCIIIFILIWAHAMVFNIFLLNRHLLQSTIKLLWSYKQWKSMINGDKKRYNVVVFYAFFYEMSEKPSNSLECTITFFWTIIRENITKLEIIVQKWSLCKRKVDKMICFH